MQTHQSFRGQRRVIPGSRKVQSLRKEEINVPHTKRKGEHRKARVCTRDHRRGGGQGMLRFDTKYRQLRQGVHEIGRHQGHPRGGRSAERRATELFRNDQGPAHRREHEERHRGCPRKKRYAVKGERRADDRRKSKGYR